MFVHDFVDLLFLRRCRHFVLRFSCLSNILAIARVPTRMVERTARR
jgi:hypothetical protein